MLRVPLRILLLLAAHLLCAELRHTEEASSTGNRVKTVSASCGKDCEDRAKVRKRSTPGTKCELYYFVPTAKRIDEAFFVWDNAKAEQLEAYHKIASFLRANPHEVNPVFFPAHLPLVEQHDNGINAMVLKDVYVRAQGMCGERDGAGYVDTTPAWFTDPIKRPQQELRILEDYVQRIPRSHWGYRVPTAHEDDVCLDDTGLVVKEFPGIRTCFSMWIFDDRDPKPKHFAGRQIYNRINQKTHLRGPTIAFDPSAGDSPGGTNRTDSPSHTNRTELFSLPALFLKEMCHVTNESLANRCTYWTSNRVYVSLCCCYANRRECAYRKYVFPWQKKSGEPEIRACATGRYYLLKGFDGNREPKNASDIASSVKQFVQEKTSSEFCKWTFTWYSSNETKLDDVLRVDLDTETPGAIIRDEPVAFARWMRTCTSTTTSSCCQRTTTLCPLDPKQDSAEVVAECFCRDDDLCNKPRSSLNKNLVEMFTKTRPCETHTVYEHLLRQSDEYTKPNTNRKHGYMCPVFYNFAHRKNAFLQLVTRNNYVLLNISDKELLREDGCHLVEVEIKEVVSCTDKLFGEHNETSYEKLLILMCSIEGNPLGAKRSSFPDAELKKTIARNLTAAKEAFPTCKNGSWSMDFESLSELVVDNHKLARLYDNLTEGTNENITTAHCYAEVSFVYQHRYDFTFGEVSIDDKPLHDACHERGGSPSRKCVQRNSTASDEHQHFVCCCQRHWSKPKGCREIMLGQLKTLLGESVIAKTPGEIMDELKNDALTKCDEADKGNKRQAGTDIDRPCARNEGCYTGVHARDVPPTTHHKKFGGCVSEYAPDAKKRAGSTSDEAEARFYRICRLPRNKDQCFAVLGTVDVALPDDVKGPQMVCCCGGQLDSAQKCGTSQKFGMKIGDFDL